MTLEEAVDQLITLGESDPMVIARRLKSMHGEAWLIEELLARDEEILASIARQHLGSQRRRSELELREGEPQSAEIMIRKAWVPKIGWKPVGKLTRADLRARADWYRALAGASLRRAEWCDQVVALMERASVDQLADLHEPLPPLPANSLEAPTPIGQV